MFFGAKKRLVIDEKSDLAEMVKDVEERLQRDFTIWDDDEEIEMYSKISRLTVEERRLMIVFALMNLSVARVSTLFSVDKKTIYNRIEEIRRKIETL